MDDPEVLQTVKDNIEFVVDLTNDKQHLLSYQLKTNESRAEEAKRIRQQVLYQDRLHNNTERIDKDVLIIYMDNISRAHFHRKMKKLNKWLDQYADDYTLTDSDTVRFEQLFNIGLSTRKIRYILPGIKKQISLT